MNFQEPKMTIQGAKDYLKNLKAPHVTEEQIKEKIERIKYIFDDHVTLCLITMKNGFVVVGMTAPAKVENHNHEVGERFAYENAFRQLWQLEGYLLREKLMES
jgi:sRNA-binding carbon storage regulator CsrA